MLQTNYRQYRTRMNNASLSLSRGSSLFLVLVSWSPYFPLGVMPEYVYTQVTFASAIFAALCPYSIMKRTSFPTKIISGCSQGRQALSCLFDWFNWFDWFGVHTLSHFPFQVRHFLDSGDPLEVIWGEDTPFYYALHLRRIDPCLAKRNLIHRERSGEVDQTHSCYLTGLRYTSGELTWGLSRTAPIAMSKTITIKSLLYHVPFANLPSPAELKACQVVLHVDHCRPRPA